MGSAGCLASAPSASCGAFLLQTPAATANEAPAQPLIGLVWAELRLGWLRALISVTSSYVIRMEGEGTSAPCVGLLPAHFQGGKCWSPRWDQAGAWPQKAGASGPSNPHEHFRGPHSRVWWDQRAVAAVCLRLLA